MATQKQIDWLIDKAKRWYGYDQELDKLIHTKQLDKLSTRNMSSVLTWIYEGNRFGRNGIIKTKKRLLSLPDKPLDKSLYKYIDINFSYELNT